MTAAERRAKLEARAIELRVMIDRFITEAISTSATSRMKMLEVSIAVQPKMEEIVRIATDTEIS